MFWSEDFLGRGLLIKRQHWIGVGPVDDQPLRSEVYASQRHAHKNNDTLFVEFERPTVRYFNDLVKMGQHWDFCRSAKGTLTRFSVSVRGLASIVNNCVVRTTRLPRQHSRARVHPQSRRALQAVPR